MGMNARLYVPGDRVGPRRVLFMKNGRVSWQGQDFTPDELERAYPGYVLELTRGFPQSVQNAGFRTCKLSDDPWNPNRTPMEALVGSYPAAWAVSLYLCWWAEGSGIKPYEWVVGASASFGVRSLAALVLITLVAFPIRRFLAGIVDRWVVDRIQGYTDQRAARGINTPRLPDWQPQNRS